MLDQPIRRRLANIAGMLASDHDGEVLNAARLLVREVKASGATIADLIASPPPSVAFAWSSPPTQPAAPHIAMVDELLAPRWGMLRSHRTEKLLRALKLVASLAPDEQAWLDKLHAKMVRLRSKAVADASVNLAEDFCP